MPVKLRRTKKTPYRISEEILDAFGTAQDTAETYISCIRGEGCFSTEVGRHCKTCHRHLEARRTLSGQLHLQPWRPDPAHVASPEEDPEMWALREEIERKLAERAKA